MRVFLDTNVFVDMFLAREVAKFNADAKKLFQIAVECETIEFCVSSVSVATSFSLGRKYVQTIDKIKSLLQFIIPLSVEGSDVMAALSSKMDDKEDALQLSCAMSNGCDLIVSRNVEHFSDSTIPVLEPEQLLRYLLD